MPYSSKIGTRERLVRFYEKNDPSKLKDIDGILVKYAGKHEQLFESLSKEYPVDVDVDVDVDGFLVMLLLALLSLLLLLLLPSALFGMSLEFMMMRY